MTPERWEKVAQLFETAVTQGKGDRTAFLDDACGGDRALRAEVESLLASDSDGEEALDGITSDIAARCITESELIGQTLAHYRIVSLLGSGGMGEVFLAEDTKLDRRVALKLLPRQFTRDTDRLRRFEQEARTASALNHPNIITIFEIGEADGTRFMATEFVDGETLRELIDGGKQRAVTDILEIGCQASDALAAAHAAGIVHRDVKPANIMLRRDGFIKVLDFGLAKLTSARAHLDVTEPGRVMGTINYMSPEQALGKPLDHRTDIFSLGVVLYELATGRRLFDGETEGATYDRILNHEAPRMHEIDPALPFALDQVVRRALEKDPAHRYQTAADLRADLRRLAHGNSETEAAKAALATQRVLRRRRTLAVAGTVALLLTIGALVFFGGRMSGHRESPLVAPNPIPKKSIAVLPFIDLSQAKDQEYFSDGVAEEILNALSQVKDLKVAGRTSSFSFKGKAEDARAIGAALGVAHILEGSVRKHGDKVRITAQLVQTSDGFRLWTENYEGELRDVFHLQELIARAMIDQLQVVLRGDQASRLVKAPTSNVDAYSLYLQATAIFNRRESARFSEAISQLEEAVRIDPNFARAHARMALIHSLAPVFDSRLRESAAEATARDVQRALELDPTLAEPHAALGQMLLNQRRFGEARASYERALALEPEDLNTSFWLAIALNSAGYLKASAEGLDKVLAKDPMLPNGLYWRGRAHLQLGQLDQAESLLRRAADRGLRHAGLVLTQVEHARGRHADAIEWLVRGTEPFMHDFPPGSARIIAEGVYGTPAQREKAVAVVDEYLSRRPTVVSGAAPFALICLGQPERGLVLAAEKPTSNDSFVFPFLWSPAGRTARILPAFSTFARRSGLAELWDIHGPPDQCRKNTNGDYVCN